MRRFALLLSLAASLVFAPTVSANQPSHFTFTFDDTFLAGGLSAACGFDVFVHLEGTAVAIVFFDKSGTVIREIDTNPSLTVTFSAPSTGNSFTFPSAGTLLTTYTGGAAVGTPALAKVTGLLAGTGSSAPDAGTLTFEAVVIAISPEGIPIIDFVNEIGSTGNRNDSVTAERCATLSA